MRHLPIIFIALFFTACPEKKPPPLPVNCYLEPDPGDCMAAIKRFYFDQNEGKCKSFTWGGCDGVVPFETLAECKSACEE